MQCSCLSAVVSLHQAVFVFWGQHWSHAGLSVVLCILNQYWSHVDLFLVFRKSFGVSTGLTDAGPCCIM